MGEDIILDLNALKKIETDTGLITALKDSDEAKSIQVIYVIGAHCFEEYHLLNNTFPNMSTIYIFEPIPSLFAHVKKFEPYDKRCKCFDLAISDKNGEADFYISSNEMASSSLLPMGTLRKYWTITYTHTHKVQTRTINALVAWGLKQPDMFFIDAQGAEYMILNGTSKDILEKMKIIYVEASTEEIYAGSKTLEDIKKLLEPTFTFCGFATQILPGKCGNALFLRRQK